MTITAALPQKLGRMWTLPGVYAPQADTHLLAQALRDEGVTADMDVLDIGTGSGALALLAARMGARVSATDISWRAVATARINAARDRQRIRVRRGDLTAPMAGRTFDLVVSNPPYVPTPLMPRAATRGASVAWNAGHAGRQAVDRICAHSHQVLKAHGVLLMVHSGLCGVEASLGRLRDAGLQCSVTGRARVPFGPVLTERLPWLRAQGLVGPDEEEEELVVIRAERS
ncbi:release factor glutamine methyltransferase [Streptomyces sp. DvalAA-14]|uniref:HemK2/MTQ2 family protein methyltransferase n=1 Tax=unclassified Streptomyces TaxID=2593676 RepID=UPI00081B78E6|nr:MULTISPECIES: HemK2/MTQ2 family protein methyltransferase [unclassified Streptomyces]MYS20528.1 methyltransferase [Streptomyces sp. SID4948]SCD71098.1 release factor glutamine methyltransferase [Streptomyces sp. DvalAA-14]